MQAIRQYATGMAALLAILALTVGAPMQPARAGMDEAAEALAHGDWAIAFREMKPLAEAGNPDAQYKLGWMYHRGDGIPVDYSSARFWFEKAAAQGQPDAELELGDLYAHGQGVMKNLTTAADWYGKAAAHGNAEAMNNLGAMAAGGEGRPADPGEALRWFTGAANKGFAGAQYNLGLIYARGEGVPVDMKAAYMWFRLAADDGNEDAPQALQAVAPTLTKQEIEAAETAADNWQAQP
ncbi:tetratricopeptide repeat protein [Hypericibacter sp.]|uniref:tetratricopeptide repeat protein n=1 Tax=Hypericibacter sp. TaxID=2705401 RepID=UPI003D6D4DA4